MGRTSHARQRLMDAAYDLIWEYSYGAVTIDAICERASVKKGSFYYFFESKSELAVTALRAWWGERAAVLEEIFSRDTPPLEHIREYMDFIAMRQLKSHEETGQVLGCPIYTLGAEIATQDEQIRSIIAEIVRQLGAYFEEAIRAAQLLGQADGVSAEARAQTLLFWYAGLLTQARIENNPDLVRDLGRRALEIIGAAPALRPRQALRA
jgi:TetR/AcrR family transcriptional repressor of nem operon